MTLKPEWYERRSGMTLSRPDDPREPYDHDLARVIHSPSFRRLQSKTQVLGLGESDFYRTRLTHSLEVAQVATGIKRWLEQPKNKGEYVDYLPNVPQLTAISLAHDIGHPPFGHGGEVALNYMMQGKGGFEGNAQTLRILAHLECKTERHGLDLTRRTMLGVLKYPVRFSKVASKHQYSRQNASNVARVTEGLRTIDSEAWRPPKCYYDEDSDLVDWILDPLKSSDKKLIQSCTGPEETEHGECDHKSLDTTIMDLSDDISYAVHDLEDAVHMKFIRDTKDDRAQIQDVFKSIEPSFLRKFSLNKITDELFGEKWERKEAISKLVHCLICSTSVEEKFNFEEPLLKYQGTISEQARKLIKALKNLVNSKVIFTPAVQTLEYSGQQLVMELFEAMESSPTRLLPSDTQLKLVGKAGDEISRVVCDHISGMTDDYAARIYERLFTPNAGSLFQKM